MFVLFRRPRTPARKKEAIADGEGCCLSVWLGRPDEIAVQCDAKTPTVPASQWMSRHGIRTSQVMESYVVCKPSGHLSLLIQLCCRRQHLNFQIPVPGQSHSRTRHASIVQLFCRSVGYLTPGLSPHPMAACNLPTHSMCAYAT